MERVVDYIINKLYEEGVKHIFFVPGTGCMHLTDALAKLEDIQKISVHHEQAAAMAALTYAKYNETLGACVVTTGCGGTNTITGVLHAWQDNVPCVFVSGQAERNHTIRNSPVPLRQFGRQETDIVKLVEPITKYAVMINDPKDVIYELEKAIYFAQSGRKGPVWIDVPLDVQNSIINPDELPHFIPDESGELPKPKSEDIDYLLTSLDASKRPVILAGNGIRLSNSIDLFNCFIDKYQIPVTYTRLGSDLIESDNPLSIGMVGMLGASRSGSFAIANSDLILVLGSRLSINTTGYEYEKFARDAKIIVVDIDQDEHSKNTVNIDKFIHSDINAFLTELNVKVPPKSYGSWVDKCKHWKEIFPLCTQNHKDSPDINMYYFIECLSSCLPEKAVVVSDAGNSYFITTPTLHVNKGQRSITSGGEAEMGYGLPGAIGAACASNSDVVAITGDGSFMMNLQELATLSQTQLSVKVCIMNNNGYSSIRHLQNTAFRGRTIGTDPDSGLKFPDFKIISEAFGLPYVKISGSEGLTSKIQKIFGIDGPVVCEVMCTPNQDFLGVAQVRNSKKRFVTRPLEDQAPFIDRDLFLSEMVIDPIDQ